MKTLTKVSEVLIAMEDQLVANGWTQGQYGSFSGSNCIVGARMAIFDTSSIYKFPHGLYERTDSFLDEFVRMYDKEFQVKPWKLKMNAVVFNDDVAKSFDDVKWLLDEAIAEAKEQEQWGML